MAVGYEYPEGGMFLGRPGGRLDLDMDGAEDLLMDENYSIARLSAGTYGTERFDSSFYGATPLDMNGDPVGHVGDIPVRNSMYVLRVVDTRANYDRVTNTCSTGGSSCEGYTNMVQRGVSRVACVFGSQICPPPLEPSSTTVSR